MIESYSKNGPYRAICNRNPPIASGWGIQELVFMLMIVGWPGREVSLEGFNTGSISLLWTDKIVPQAWGTEEECVSCSV